MYDRYSLIDMFGPVAGENWGPAQIEQGLSFRRMSGSVSSLILPKLGAMSLRVFLVLAEADMSVDIEAVELQFDSRDVEVGFQQVVRSRVLWCDVNPIRLARGELTIKSLRPLAFSRIEIFARDPAPEAREIDEMAVLRNALAERDADVGRLRQDLKTLMGSRSLRITAPLRWIWRIAR